MTLKIFHDQSPRKNVADFGGNLRPPGLQSDVHSTEPPRPAHSIANRDGILKVMLILTMTFALWIIFWSEETSLQKFEGPSPKHCLVIRFFVLEVTVTFLKQSQIISFLVLKVMVTLTFVLRIIYW